MKRKLLSLVLVAALVLSVLGPAAYALDTRASDTLDYYDVTISKGSKSGEVDISFTVAAASIADSVGVSSIKIYRSNGGGAYVTTIRGTLDNGLLASGSSRHSATYTYDGVSGISYYAVVTVTATIGGVTDSRTVTTSTVQAP